MVTVLIGVLLIATQAPSGVRVPETPQGRRVAAYIQAFNTGDEKIYLAMQEVQMQPEVLKRRSADERSSMFRRLKGDFGTMKVTKVLSQSDTEITLLIPTTEGNEATFTFSFAAEKPHLISGIAVDIDGGPGE